MTRINGILPPAQAARITKTKLYRWAANDANSASCEGKHYEFFEAQPDNAQRGFEVIRLVVALQQKHGAGATLSIDDEYARSNRAYLSKRPSDHANFPKEATTSITDGRAALAQFPITSISRIDAYSESWPSDLLNRKDLAEVNGTKPEAVRLFAGGLWSAGIVLSSDRIRTARFVREIPPPF